MQRILIVSLFMSLSICGLSQTVLNRFFDPLLKVPSGIQVLQTSSHNKTGLNGDEDWPQYLDEKGEEVILDVAGPGCIRQMWGTNFDPEGIIKFYFDGEQTPRYQSKIIDFYKGKADFLQDNKALVSYEKRGQWGDAPYAGNSFMPIPFEKHMKVTIKGMAHFYHIIYEKYSGNKTSNQGSLATAVQDREKLHYIVENLHDLKPEYPGAENVVYQMTEPLRPGTSVPLFQDSLSGGIIREMIIEGDGSEDFFRETYIRMRWDSATRYQVMAPIGIFFGSANRQDNMLEFGIGDMKMNIFGHMSRILTSTLI